MSSGMSWAGTTPAPPTPAPPRVQVTSDPPSSNLWQILEHLRGTVEVLHDEIESLELKVSGIMQSPAPSPPSTPGECGATQTKSAIEPSEYAVALLAVTARTFNAIFRIRSIIGRLDV